MSTPDERFLLILTTAGSDEQAREIARALVERRLAACVNVQPSGCSVFRWRGEIQEEAERLLVIKSSARLFERVRDAIRELHSYDLPEVIAVPVETGDTEYLAWLSESLRD